MGTALMNTISIFYTKHRRMPSYREIMNLTDYQTTSAVHYAVQKLVDTGALSKDRKGKLLPGKHLHEVPFVGLVEAGFPSPAEEELVDTMSLDDYLIENREATYLMRVKGDSMIDAGIVEGDMLLVERTTRAKPGNIVIASVDGERTVKYLRQRAGTYYLEPANPAYKPITPKETLTIEAIVRAVVRKY